MQPQRSITIPVFDMKDALGGDKPFDYADYDEYRDRMDEPMAASSTEEIVYGDGDDYEEIYPDEVSLSFIYQGHEEPEHEEEEEGEEDHPHYESEQSQPNYYESLPYSHDREPEHHEEEQDHHESEPDHHHDAEPEEHDGREERQDRE